MDNYSERAGHVDDLPVWGLRKLGVDYIKSGEYNIKGYLTTK